MSEHTPGPWWYGRADGYVYATYLNEPVIVADVHHRDSNRLADGEPEANGNLFAAAPDLLAACRAMSTILESCVDWSEDPADNPFVGVAGKAIDAARAAIAKAKGTP